MTGRKLDKVGEGYRDVVKVIRIDFVLPLPIIFLCSICSKRR